MLPNVPKKLKYYPNIPWANPEILKKNRNSQKILGWPGDVPKTHFLKKNIRTFKVRAVDVDSSGSWSTEPFSSQWFHSAYFSHETTPLSIELAHVELHGSQNCKSIRIIFPELLFWGVCIFTNAHLENRAPFPQNARKFMQTKTIFPKTDCTSQLAFSSEMNMFWRHQASNPIRCKVLAGEGPNSHVLLRVLQYRYRWPSHVLRAVVFNIFKHYSY